MKSSQVNSFVRHASDVSYSKSNLPAGASKACHWVTAAEVQDLRAALRLGRVPLDLQVKLAMLAGGDLRHHAVAQHSQIFLGLLLAAAQGAFCQGTSAEHERLLHTLAYVRKMDDAIPDHRSDGYLDDHREVQAAVTELAPLLHEFKLWRLRHQVPDLWSNHSVGGRAK